MNSPAAALTWEIWRKHGSRILVMLGTMLAFAVFYPKLCALNGIDLKAPNALDSLVSTLPNGSQHSFELGRVLHALMLLFLLLGPLGFMVVSLFYVTWIFTFTEGDPHKGFALPSRLFRLPISTGFLSTWLMLAGAMAITLLVLGWTRLVHQPSIDVFAGYRNPLVWVAVLVTFQACLWALDGIPVARVVLLALAFFLFGFLIGPSAEGNPFIARNRTVILVSLLGLGGITAPIGLKMVRRGDWQRLRWPGFVARFRARFAPQTFSPPKLLRSASAAQLWFEWRRQGRRLCLYVLALSGAGLLTMTVVCLINGGLGGSDTFGLILYLLGVPLFIHFVHGIAPERSLAEFIAIRPLTTGQAVAAKLKSATLSAVICWLITVVMVALLILLGDVPSAIREQEFLGSNAPLLILFSPVILLGLIVLSWRFVAVNLCFGAGGHSWISRLPVVLPYAMMAGAGILSFLARSQRFEQALLDILPLILGGMLLLKLAAAAWAVRICLRRELFTISAVFGYLLVWAVLSLIFVGSVVHVLHASHWALTAVLGILVLMPLARIAMTPLALATLRHR